MFETMKRIYKKNKRCKYAGKGSEKGMDHGGRKERNHDRIAVSGY